MSGPPYTAGTLRCADDAIAPAIGAAALRTHRTIHAAYVEATNRLLSADANAAGKTIEAVLSASDELPLDRRDTVIDFGGAHANHQFFWKIIGPDGVAPAGTLAAAITRDFGSVAVLEQEFRAASLALAGPGFAFLSLAAPRVDRLEVVVLPGNGSVLAIGKPGIVVCDLWEHAWAADHANRGAWLDAFWTIVDWRVAGDRYEALRAGHQPA